MRIIDTKLKTLDSGKDYVIVEYQNEGDTTVQTKKVTADQIGGGGGGTADFNALVNRPKYNNETMSSTTNIPEVKTTTWDGKQDSIVDLNTIRAGAAAGATAVQPTTLASYSTTSEMNTAIAAHHDSTKQDVLTAGTGITIENNVISASASGVSYIPYETISTHTYSQAQTDYSNRANVVYSPGAGQSIILYPNANLGSGGITWYSPDGTHNVKCTVMGEWSFT